MSKHCQTDGRDGKATAIRNNTNADGQGPARVSPKGPDGRPRVLVQVIERTALVRFADAEILFAQEAVRSVGDQLDRLVAEESHTRLLLNFRGVRYVSGAMLGRLAALLEKIGPARGRIQLCGLDPLLRDMMRITHLDRVFDVYADEAEALGFTISR